MQAQLLGRLTGSNSFVAIFVFSILTCVLPAAGQGVRVERTEQIVNQRQVGWEHVLTDRDPNLSHWHWEPITNAYKKVQSRTLYDPGRQNTALNEPRARIKNPAATQANYRNYADANGKLIRTQTSSPVATPTVLTYGQIIKSPPATMSNQQAHMKVAGKIVRMKNSNI
ncbi:MAG TPA: hypothetical protein V6C97_32415 [Oculatellaceae cyanobacterium]